MVFKNVMSAGKQQNKSPIYVSGQGYSYLPNMIEGVMPQWSLSPD